MSKEMVNSPAHYNQGNVECIDAIREALGEDGFVSYCRGNALKYNWRAGHKRDGIEDLQKAVWYSRMAAGDDPRDDDDYAKTPNAALSPISAEYCKHGAMECDECGFVLGEPTKLVYARCACCAGEDARGVT